MGDWGPFTVAGKRVIVTGGAKGIGFGIARRFAEGGARVVIADLDEAGCAAAAGKLVGMPGEVVTVAADVGADDAPGELVGRAVEAFGGVDVLVNNAGIFPSTPALKMTREFYDRVMRVNLRALVFLSQEAAKQMIAQGTGGVIINIGSIDALHPSMVGLAAYDASKGGVAMFTRSFALEMAPNGVRVNAIHPGGVTTEGTSKPLEGSGMTAEQMRKFLEQFTAQVPLRRMGVPDDIATVTVFLASNAASYVTGAALIVDGGRLLG